MSGSSTIEWTDATWNPVTGCTRVSPGCAHCYIERTPPFRMAGRRFEHGANGATTGVILHPERLEQPLRWRKPRRVFVNSLSDLFHEDIPYEFIRDVFNTMRRCDGGIVAATGKADPSHVFQVLTKRPERALELWRDRKLGFVDWPAHIWLGVSIENARFTWRADVLREIPAAVRFLSCEPLLGSLIEGGKGDSQGAREIVYERYGFDAGIHRDLNVNVGRAPLDLSGIDWVIVGGESGPGARPMHPDWARELRDACLATDPLPTDAAWVTHGTRFFFKQWGEWAPSDQCGVRNVKMTKSRFQYESRRFAPDGTAYRANEPDLYSYPGMESLLRVGKKKAGRLLDGREWNEMPVSREAVPA